MTQKQTKTVALDSIEALETRRTELSGEIDKSEEKLSNIWHELFREPTEEEKNSPTQRAISFVTSSAGLIDGALLGWKLYRKFNKGSQMFSFFRKKKK